MEEPWLRVRKGGPARWPEPCSCSYYAAGYISLLAALIKQERLLAS